MLNQRIGWFAALPLLGMALTLRPDVGRCQEDYRHYFDLAEREKGAGNYAGMEAALKSALQYGPGDEYAWRSLAWAQARQGKWEESLETAWTNIRRNGEWGWSLKQLFESAVAAGDLELARQALEKARQLPPPRQNVDLSADWQQLTDLTGTRIYSIEWKIDPQQGGPEAPPVRVLMPQSKYHWQTFEYEVSNVVSWKKVREDQRDFIEVVQKPGEPLYVRGTLTHGPFLLGAKRLASVPAQPCPEDLKSYLGPFRNSKYYDPQSPEVTAIAEGLQGKTSAETVQNVLNWLAQNMKYEAGHSDELSEILRTKRGVCHHYCNLMVTLCRAAGVPAVVAHGMKIPTTGTFSQHEGSHGWAEVYLNTLGWVPVEPLDPNSLRSFRAAGYLFFDTSGHSLEDDHFRFWSAQGAPIDGQVVEVKMPSSTAD